jgi:hypothetical protein
MTMPLYSYPLSVSTAIIALFLYRTCSKKNQKVRVA